MLPTNFEPLARAEPELKGTFRLLQKWVQGHSDRKWIDPTWVARDYPLLDVFKLSLALDRAVREGLLAVRYTVLTPSGVLASDIFDSPESIPERLPDRFERYFDTSDLPIIPIFLSSQDVGVVSLAAEGQGRSLRVAASREVAAKVRRKR